MIHEINVRFVPSSISDSDCDGCVVVMVDVLRASTTMIQALNNGAATIYPRAEIDESRQLARELGNDAILGGERNGKIVEGFHLGNSPLEYSRGAIENKPIVLCTTNGTFTLNHCRSASKLWIGSFANLNEVCRNASDHEKLLIACAGTNRMVSDEDVLFAGAVVNQLLQANSQLNIDDAGRIAASRWQAIQPLLESGTQLWEILAKSHGGRNLMRLGYDRDVQFCADVNSIPVLPELDLQTWTIHAAVPETP